MKTNLFGRLLLFACSVLNIEKDHIFKSIGISFFHVSCRTDFDVSDVKFHYFTKQLLRALYLHSGLI